MKKMLQVTNVDFTVEKFLINLIKKCEEEYEVHIACAKGECFENLKDLNMKYIDAERRINFTSNIKTIYQLYKLMKKEKYDLIHVHSPIMSVLARISAKLAGAKVVVYTAHGFYFHDDMKKWVYNFFVAIEKVIGKYFTDFIFTQSYEDYILAKEKGFNKAENILCIGNGINLKTFNILNVKEEKIEIRKSFELENDDFVIVFVGRLVKEKGIFDLLEAFKMLSHKYNKVKLLVVGDNVKGDRDTEFFEKYKSLINDSNIEANIRFLGLRNDINRILKAGDIFVLPSYREGMPRSIIEAMAMEKVVIATNIRGCREEVVDGETGYLVPVNSYKDIYTKISGLIMDRDKVNLMGTKGKARAELLYDEENVIEMQIKVFKKLLENERG